MNAHYQIQYPRKCPLVVHHLETFLVFPAVEQKERGDEVEDIRRIILISPCQACSTKGSQPGHTDLQESIDDLLTDVISMLRKEIRG